MADKIQVDMTGLQTTWQNLPEEYKMLGGRVNIPDYYDEVPCMPSVESV